jgi:hypothetical protein
MRQEIAEAKVKWSELVSEQSKSGLSVAAFCNQHGLRPGRESEAARFAEVQVAVPAEPVRPAGARSGAIEIRLREGRSLAVEPGFDAKHLRALLSVLESEA